MWETTVIYFFRKYVGPFPPFWVRERSPFVALFAHFCTPLPITPHHRSPLPFLRGRKIPIVLLLLLLLLCVSVVVAHNSGRVKVAAEVVW